MSTYSLESRLTDCHRAAATYQRPFRGRSEVFEGLGQCYEMSVGFVCILVGINNPLLPDEVVIFAALYLKLKKSSVECDPKEKAAMIADILKPERSGKTNRDAFIELLLNSNGDLDDLVFTKALHVRIQLRTHDHPKDENSKNIFLTDSKVKVDVSL